MLVITVAGLKGGIGKSTLTLNLGMTFRAAGHRVLLVDADVEQGTLQRWAQVSALRELEGIPVASLAGPALRRDLPKVAQGFDVVLVDSPPRLGADARSAVLCADVVLLPVLPGAPDAWALEQTLRMIDEARSVRPELRVAVILNRTDRSTLTTATRRLLNDADISVLPTPLHARVVYGKATAAGEGVVTYEPNSEAAIEMRRLTKDIVTYLNDAKTIEETHEQRCTA